MPIGEFSVRSGLSPKRLRSYAADGLLLPAAVDPASGYRFYSPGQLREAHVIDTLRQAGMPLTGIRAFLRHPSSDQLDDWARQLEDDSSDRHRALDAARHLLVSEIAADASTPSLHDNEQGTGKRSMTKLSAAGRTEIGRVRENNEDAIVANDHLALVADGLGGCPSGEVASGVAAGLLQAVCTGASLDELEAAIRAANWAIWDRAIAYPALQGMGSTICALALIEDDAIAVANVGDSRAYLRHDGNLVRLTQDHTVTAELVRQGELSEQEAARHPHRGILTRALGVAPEVEIDSAVHRLVEGDRFLVCSDGIFNELSDDEITTSLGRSADVAEIADDLVDRAISRGGRDNVSVVVGERSA
jgi:serine/threonine protein phosphatase PrpC